ncbi:MAG TPA: Hsp20/alpha crystallin family protein [Burkholderiales bacterium]|nr:Hsp20/alpha crystallin family protein [Burkholderiales bacterium]
MANITRYDPFEDVFGDLLKGFFVRPVNIESPSQSMLKIDVTEDEKAFKVQAELPGVKKEDINVSIDGSHVAINAEVKKEHEEKDGERVLRSERFFGKFSRSFQLDQDVDESKAEAKYTDGVLQLVLPKKAAVSAKRLSIS